MKKRIALFLVLAALAALSVSAFAQAITVIKGNCKDENGKPYVGYVVEITNLDNGQKVSVKTDKGGNYTSLGGNTGNYRIRLVGPDGKEVYVLNNVPIRLGTENNYPIDMAKERGAQQEALTPEQKALMEKNEKIKKENEKIKGLNGMLLQAKAQREAGQCDAAVATMQEAAATDTTHEQVFASLADSDSCAKKWPEAEAAYRKAIELAKPDSKSLPGYHSNLALMLAKQGKTEDGMAECDTTAKLDPTQAGQCYFNEGAILTNQGKADDANVAFDKAIAADPNKAEAYYQKGVNLLAKATLGKDGKMVPVAGTAEALNKYLELAPEGKNAAAAKELLASIGASVQTSFGTEKKKGTKK